VHYFLMAVMGAVALFWFFNVIDVARGVPKLKSLADAPPLADADCPTVSILFAARDEADKLPEALETMLAADYPRYEVIAVNDRSVDATREILESAARRDDRLKNTRVDSLPAGWLGKPHALQKGFERSTGEWLIFTDADVHFAPDLLRRSVALAEQQQWDHMPLFGTAKMFTIGERIALTFFALCFLLNVRPWHVSNPRSRFYAGIGAFQLIRRSTYEAIGTHRRLAMEVVDDLKLGKLVKNGGFRSGVAKAGDAVSVHWHSGVGNIIRGTTKNFFATAHFRLWVACIQVISILLLFVFPVAAIPFVSGWTRVFAIVATAMPMLAQAGVAMGFGVSPLYALTMPVGALIFSWMLARSTIVTLWTGGIMWRDTFYPLEELKRGIV
jgi:glycosyltransferase involved in cell wall biosynthesis